MTIVNCHPYLIAPSTFFWIDVYWSEPIQISYPSYALYHDKYFMIIGWSCEQYRISFSDWLSISISNFVCVLNYFSLSKKYNNDFCGHILTYRATTSPKRWFISPFYAVFTTFCDLRAVLFHRPSCCISSPERLSRGYSWRVPPGVCIYSTLQCQNTEHDSRLTNQPQWQNIPYVSEH